MEKEKIAIFFVNNRLAQVAKAMIAFGVLASHAIFCNVATDTAWTQYFHKRVEKSDRKLLWEYLLRTGVVFITFVLAVAIPNLELFIGLFGSLVLSTLGISIPAILECAYKWNRTSGRQRTFMFLKNLIISVIGLAGLVIGSTLSLKDIIKTYTD